MLLRACARRPPARRSLLRCLSTTTANVTSSATADSPVAAATGAAVRSCARAILAQHAAFLQALDDRAYTFASPLLQASVAQHTRHSLDHLRKPVEAVTQRAAAGGVDVSLVRYDVRQRNTEVEQDRGAALAQIDALQRALGALDDAALEQPLSAAFMLAADGREVAFESTLSRELAFAVHHCIHHNALSKVLLRLHFPDAALPPDFGMAPSTTNFLSTTGAAGANSSNES